MLTTECVQKVALGLARAELGVYNGAPRNCNIDKASRL